MRRKCPRTGDIVRWQTDGKSIGWVIRREGIFVFVRFFEAHDLNHPGGVLLRRDNMEVISSANN